MVLIALYVVTFLVFWGIATTPDGSPKFDDRPAKRQVRSNYYGACHRNRHWPFEHDVEAD